MVSSTTATTDLKEFLNSIDTENDISKLIDIAKSKSFTCAKVRNKISLKLSYRAIEKITNNDYGEVINVLSILQDFFIAFPGETNTINGLFQIGATIHKDCKDSNILDQMYIILTETFGEISTGKGTFLTSSVFAFIDGFLLLDEFCIKGSNLKLINFVWKGLAKLIANYAEELRSHHLFKAFPILKRLESYIRKLIEDIIKLGMESDVRLKALKMLKFYILRMSDILHYSFDILDPKELQECIACFAYVLELLRCSSQENIELISFTLQYFSGIMLNSFCLQKKKFELLISFKPFPEETISECEISLDRFLLFLSLCQAINQSTLVLDEAMFQCIFTWSFKYFTSSSSYLFDESSNSGYFLYYIRFSLSRFLLQTPPQFFKDIQISLLDKTFSTNPVEFELSALLWIDMIKESTKQLQNNIVTFLINASVEVSIEYVQRNSICRLLKNICSHLPLELQVMIVENCIKDILTDIFAVDNPPDSSTMMWLRIHRLGVLSTPSLLISHSTIVSQDILLDCIDCCLHLVPILQQTSTVSHEESLQICVHSGLAYLKGIDINALDEDKQKNLLEIFLGILPLHGSSRIIREEIILEYLLEGVIGFSCLLECRPRMRIYLLTTLLEILKASRNLAVVISWCVSRISDHHIHSDIEIQKKSLSLYNEILHELLTRNLWSIDSFTIQALNQFGQYSNAADIYSFQLAVPQRLKDYYLHLIMNEETMNSQDQKCLFQEDLNVLRKVLSKKNHWFQRKSIVEVKCCAALIQDIDVQTSNCADLNDQMLHLHQSIEKYFLSQGTMI